MRSIIGFLGYLVAVGCGPNIVGSDPVVPEQNVEQRGDYPDGPYGTATGDTLENLTFAGYFTDVPSVGAGEYLEGIDFQRIRELGSYRYLLINVAAEWCIECRTEAQLLPSRFEAWAERGGYVFGVIVETLQRQPAPRGLLDLWRNTYPLNYTMVHDPQDLLRDRFAIRQLPLNVIVDLDTMTIINQRTGGDLRFLDVFEAQLE